MIVPASSDDALLSDIASAPEDGTLHFWWLGQSGFLLKCGSFYALIDPYLSDSLTRKYAGTQKEHVRMTARCIDPARLGFVQLVAASHMHTDHCDPETLGPLARAAKLSGTRAKLLLPRSGLAMAKERLAGAEFDYIAIDATESVQVGPLVIKAIASAHPTVERDGNGACLFLGYIIRLGNFAVYHSGDTLWHAGLMPQLLVEHPDVALLPINGNKPERGVAGNLNGTEAAALAKACGASLAIPHHFGMFKFNTESPLEFISACGRLGQNHRVLMCGERWSSIVPITR
jgi:L-ascorbate metabolism protein UlaG (beta-lactamase superfamily)